jgi:hypothetical protein
MKNKFNIEEIKLLIPDYVSGSLTEEENSLVKNAIDSSDELKELYLDMKNAFEYADTIKYEEPAPRYWNNLLPKIHEKIEAREQQSLAKNPISYIWKILVPVAAVVLIFIIYKISFTPDSEISQNQDRKIQEEKTVTKDTIKEEISPLQTKDEIKPEITKNNVLYKKTKTNAVDYENIEQPDMNDKEQVKENEIKISANDENEDFASLGEELSIFGAGEQGTIDDDLDNELEKLSSSDQENFLEELSNSNL